MTATDPKQPCENADQMLSRVVMLRTLLVLLLTFTASTACSPDETPVKVKTGELEQLVWPVDEEAPAKAWQAEQSDIKALRGMVDDADFSSVALFGDILSIRTTDNEIVAVEDLTSSDEWIALMNGASVSIISRRIGITTLIVTPPRTANDTTVYANYIHHHPMPEMQCKEQYRSVSCGICDVTLDFDWSLRLTWSSGAFEVESSESRSKFYQDKDSSLSIEEIESTYEESKRKCMKSGLAEMGHGNPENFYSFGGNLTLSAEAKELIGVWPLCVDPDRRAKDSLLFESDGSGYVLRRDKPNIEFLYRAKGTSLTLFMRAGERAIRIPFEISPDGRRLLMYREKTKSTSFYVRESDVTEFDCDSE